MKGKRSVFSVLTIAAIILGLVLTACSSGAPAAPAQKTESKPAASQPSEKPAAKADKSPYKIGAVFSITGLAAPQGTPERDAAVLVVEQINKAGGIDGHPIELVLEDDGSEPSKLMTAVTKLINQDNVLGIAGTTMSNSALAGVPVVEKAGVPMLVPASASALTDPVKKNIFRTAEVNSIVVTKMLDYFKNVLKAKKIAVIYSTSAGAAAGAQELVTAAKGAGMQIVAEEKYDEADTDMTAQLTRIKASGADAIHFWGINQAAGIVLKNKAQLGMTLPIVGPHGLANPIIFEIGGAEGVKGLVFPTGKIADPVSIPQGDPQRDIVQKFYEAFKAKYNYEPNPFSAYAADAVGIMLEALKKSGPDRTKLRDEIEKVSRYPGVTGIYTYSPTNHDGLSPEGLIMVEVVGGKMKMKK